MIGADTDAPSHPLGDKQDALREQGFAQKVNGKTDGPVAEVAKGQYVELEREGEDSIWTVIGQFGAHGLALRDPPERSARARAQPDPRARPDGRQHDDLGSRLHAPTYYEDMLFSEAPSATSRCATSTSNSRSNRYTVNGDVTDWVSVPYNAAHYGRELLRRASCALRPGASSTTRSTPGTTHRSPPGRPTTDIAADLAQFDVWDRYDIRRRRQLQRARRLHRPLPGGPRRRGRGDRRRRPGHRCHLEPPLVRLLLGQRSRRRSAPSGFGGVQIGDTGFWIGDYTVEPENGGVGVFATSSATTSACPTSTTPPATPAAPRTRPAFWTLYSCGSYGSTGIARPTASAPSRSR